jgi:KDO2-lipid IV(A) lauroyltransferase
MTSKRRRELDSSPTGPASWPLYGLLVCLSYVACCFPAPVVYGLAHILAVPFFAVTVLRERKLNRRHRGAQRNMRIAFGRDLPPRALRRLTWRYARHLAWLVVDILRLRLVTRRRLGRVVDVSEVDPLLEEVREGKGVICVAGHFGSWEGVSYCAALLGIPLTSLARPFPEPGVQRWLYANREPSGQRVLSKFGGVRLLQKCLGRGESVGIVADENVRRGGIFVPFCGVLAATGRTAYVLQRRSGATIYVGTCQRLSPGRSKIHVWRRIVPRSGADPEEEQRRVITEVVGGFEDALRTYPEQWIWSLRRWATRPEGESFDADGLPPRVGPPLQLRKK